MSNNKNTTCFKGDGTVSPDIPCGFISSSHCCGEGWDCLTNGLCRNHGTTAYSQGSCTDPSFINCLDFCNGGKCTVSLLSLREHSHISDLEDQFQGFTEVSRCDANANSWCCAGAAGQGLGGPDAVDCCSTNLTTSLEPYPLATIEELGTSTRTTKTTTLRSVSSVTTRSDEDSTLSTRTPTRSSTSTRIPQNPNFASSPSSVISSAASSSASSQPAAKQSHEDSKLAIKIAVPMAVVVIILLACLIYLILRRNRFQFLRRWGPTDARDKYARYPLTHASEHHELAGNSIPELDVTHYELPHPKAPQHELG